MTDSQTNKIDLIPFADNEDRRIARTEKDFLIERHTPNLFHNPYHHHTSIEVNFLENCSLTYAFSGGSAKLESGSLAIFWGASPHRVTDLTGVGTITNVYLSLRQFTQWQLPNQLGNAVLSGAVVVADPPDPQDAFLFDRLYNERGRASSDWRRTHLSELEVRLRRLAMSGWKSYVGSTTPAQEASANPHGVARVEAMLRFIVENFTVAITVDDVAEAANLSPSRASHLFQEVMGIGLKKHISATRLSHACMLLTESDAKVAAIANDTGFASISAFYEAFKTAYGISPVQYRKNERTAFSEIEGGASQS